MISRRLKYTNTAIFCLLESDAIVFGLVFVSALPGAREPGSQT